MLAATGKNENNGMFSLPPSSYLCYLHCVFQYCIHGRSLHNDSLMGHIKRSVKYYDIVLFARTAIMIAILIKLRNMLV